MHYLSYIIINYFYKQVEFKCIITKKGFKKKKKNANYKAKINIVNITQMKKVINFN